MTRMVFTAVTLDRSAAGPRAARAVRGEGSGAARRRPAGCRTGVLIVQAAMHVGDGALALLAPALGTATRVPAAMTARAAVPAAASEGPPDRPEDQEQDQQRDQ